MIRFPAPGRKGPTDAIGKPTLISRNATYGYCIPEIA